MQPLRDDGVQYRPPVVAAPPAVHTAPPGGYGHPRAGRSSRTGCVITLVFMAALACTLAYLVAGLFP